MDQLDEHTYLEIDALVESLYTCMSFGPGSAPDWETLRSLFATNGQLIRAGASASPEHMVLNVETFIRRSSAHLEQSDLKQAGFSETETMRRSEFFGRVAHVFSSYQSKNLLDDRILARGTNSIQLIWDTGRWWIVSLAWDEHALSEKA